MTRTTFPTVMLRLEQIETDPDNVFRHEDGDLQRLVGAIHSFGFLAAITVDADSMTVKDGIETYRLVGGEARVEAARAAGLTEIPATLATFESEDARTAAGIALNAHFGHFDDSALSEVLRDLRRHDYDLDLTALMPGQLDDLLGTLETDKPPYIMPSMADIHAREKTFTVVSTFAGGGGSCTGYAMAGGNVLWANEFLPAAQDTYRANHPDTILDTRSIRDVQPEEILEAIGLEAGELDIFDGSPPCQSFSTAGQREKAWGKVRDYGHGIQQRNDDLFFEYARLLKGLQPKVFIAENVSGLVKGTAKGYFKDILRTFKACGYTVEAKLLDAQWLGVPQARQRIIFIGVRNDLDMQPVFPKPLPYRYSVRDAIDDLDGRRVMDDTSGLFSIGDVTERPAPTVTAHGTGQMFIEGANGYNGHAYQSADKPAATVQAGRPLNDIERSETLVTEWGDDRRVHSLKKPAPTRSALGINGRLASKAFIETTHELRLPPSRDRAYDGQDAYNFQVAKAEQPAPTITCASPGNDVGHPVQRRKFSIAELKRICSFPDDYILTGSYADQWERCGNSVPPVMMAHIASTVRDSILLPLRAASETQKTAP